MSSIDKIYDKKMIHFYVSMLKMHLQRLYRGEKRKVSKSGRQKERQSEGVKKGSKSIHFICLRVFWKWISTLQWAVLTLISKAEMFSPHLSPGSSLRDYLGRAGGKITWTPSDTFPPRAPTTLLVPLSCQSAMRNKRSRHTSRAASLCSKWCSLSSP